VRKLMDVLREDTLNWETLYKHECMHDANLITI